MLGKAWVFGSIFSAIVLVTSAAAPANADDRRWGGRPQWQPPAYAGGWGDRGRDRDHRWNRRDGDRGREAWWRRDNDRHGGHHWWQRNDRWDRGRHNGWRNHNRRWWD